MEFPRNKRWLAGLGAVAATVTATLFVVLPALASSPGDYINPPSTGAGVLPLDVAVGGNGVCQNLFTGSHSLGAGVMEYDNNNPKTATGQKSGNGDGVTFDLTVHSPSNTTQTLDVVGHHAAILGIGIKGGTQSTAYDYLHGTAAGFVLGDSGLHAPLQNNSYTTVNGVETGSSFYSISLLNVCYTALSYVQGTVYEDLNQDGASNDGQGSLRQGWQVNLYSGVTPGVQGSGTLVSSQTTDANGYYHFDLPATGTTYRVCEVPAGSPSNGAPNWVQDQPLPSTAALCNGAGELPKGYEFTPTSATGATDDFGNVGGYPCSSAGAQVGSGPYTVGTCKNNQLYVFSSGTSGNGVPYQAYWVGDPSQSMIPTVEQINFDDPIVNGQPVYKSLLYADGGGFPVNTSNLLTMPYCLLDPRSPQSDGFSLATTYQDVNNAGSVIPNFSVAKNQTSCVISLKVTSPTDASKPGRLQAYVYALGDPIRGAGH